jgi:hypothetical protein
MITRPMAVDRGRISASEAFSIRRRQFHTNTKRRHRHTNISQRGHTIIGQHRQRHTIRRRRDQATTLSCRRGRPQVYVAPIPMPATSSNHTRMGCSLMGT